MAIGPWSDSEPGRVRVRRLLLTLSPANAHAFDAFETRHRLVPDGALCGNPRDGPDRSLYLDEREVGDGRRSVLVGNGDAHLCRGLDNPDASPPDRGLGILLFLESWHA